ncbi:bacteriophage abortive infection AbiH family protein [Aquibacillus rhizosphaerae]|uniref:Bacteriophage abortive infection AbiH family protein n=1 Tax=Aquibacillus rhizosphaerae TaxID=3051431 RepID=A0ABT7L577_9BACI|nr:bacteriophage abortive infection AbiH family protein [Aquibacillus sp. LR5S19]MDL4840350.1 bacteriophage abortive infection AbiH family protein [Aquibacillus sp. LR5S19]
MANLFVIGNGFDLDHRLETSYNHFRDYLISIYPEIKFDEFTMPNERDLPDGGIEYDDIEVLSMLFYLINVAEQNEEKWSNIEKSLGELDFSEAFDWYDDILDKDGDIDMWKTSYRNEDLVSHLVIPALRIQEFFSEWVNSINLITATPKRDFIKLLNDGDQYLTFNYTETLEMVYDIHPENICHVHGKQEEEIFFGHGNKEDYYESYMQSNIGSENGLSSIDRQLRKETEKALKYKFYFFENLADADITNIYSYGFSFNEVDAIYLEEICKRINTVNVIWHFNDFDIWNVDQYKTYLKKCGFKGHFNIYHISG